MRTNEAERFVTSFVTRRAALMIVGVAGLLMTAEGLHAQRVLELPATTNALVRRSQGDQSEVNFLEVKRLNDINTRIAYLRFNLADLVGASPTDVTNATLRLYQTTSTAESVRVWGLNDNAANGGVTEPNWTDALTYDTQPAGVVANTAASLPNEFTVDVGEGPTDVTPGVYDIPLTLSNFQGLLAGDTNQQVTLLISNRANANPRFASIGNTAGNTVPTLVLTVVPEPGSALLLSALPGCCLLRRRRGR